jgi:hypothetical protein
VCSLEKLLTTQGSAACFLLLPFSQSRHLGDALVYGVMNLVRWFTFMDLCARIGGTGRVQASVVLDKVGVSWPSVQFQGRPRKLQAGVCPTGGLDPFSHHILSLSIGDGE